MKNKMVHNHDVPALHVDESVSLEDQIAQRAYELWHHRGRKHGNDFADWLHAESEINEWHRKRLEAKASSATSR